MVDKDWTHQRSSTARSVAAIRQQFHLEENVRLSLFGARFFSGAAKVLGRDIGFEESRYLVLAGPGGEERLQAALRNQKAAGANVEWVDADDLGRRFAWLNPEGLAGATLSGDGEGWIDPKETLGAMRAFLEDRGVEFVTSSVTSLAEDGGSIGAALGDDGSVIEGDIFVNAAGPQAGRLMSRSGFELPVESRKRCAFVFEPGEVPEAYPCLVDPTIANRSVFSRPLGNAFLAVTSPDPDSDPDTDDLSVDHALFDDLIRPGLARRVRSFERMELIDAWAGHYEVNTFDQNAVIGGFPEADNLYLVCGFSGHGVMHAPGAGRGVAELITTGDYQTLDLSCFAYERIRDGVPLDDLQPSEHREVEAGI